MIFSESDEEEENPVSLCDKVSLYKGDITILEVDAIVNAGKRFGPVRNVSFRSKLPGYELALLYCVAVWPSDAPVCCVCLPPSACTAFFSPSFSFVFVYTRSLKTLGINLCEADAV